MKKNNGDKLRMYSLLSVLTMIIGIALLIFMIVVEDELGAIPLLLITLGIGGYFIIKSKVCSHQSQL